MTDQPSEPIGGVSFADDEETRLILDSLDEFVETEVVPLQRELGDTYTNPRRRHRTDGRFVKAVVDAMDRIRKKSAEAGFYAMNLPGDEGGEGVSNVTWYRANRSVAASGVPLARYVLAGPEGPKPLLLQAEGEQVDRYLEPTIRGEKTTAFAQTEPGVGSDSPNMSTTARKEGDEWVINGTKQWITNAPYADFLQVFARTTPQEEAGRYGGITCFLVGSDEYELGPMNNAVGQIGLQSEVLLDDVRVPEVRVLGEEGEAFYEAMDFLSLGRLEVGAIAIGHSEYLLEEAAGYARDREAFGSPIGDYQAVAHQIARGRARAFAADAAGLRLAWRMDRDLDTVEVSSIFKWFATNVYWDIADAAVQVHGANGLSEENEFMEKLAYAKVLRIVEGTDEIQLNTIAKQVGLL
jgi:acyl-CoA dehydrogenase